MSAEDDVMARLSASVGQVPPPHHYGEGDDHVFEEYGSRAHPDVVVLHGGAWRPDIDRASTRPLCRALAEAGLHVYLPEYRRTPGNPMDPLDDVEDFLGYLAGHGRRVRVIVGHSSGGHLALLYAAAYKTSAPRVVALAPVADLFLQAAEGQDGEAAISTWLGVSRQEKPGLWHRLNPVEHLVPEPEGITILHGDEDRIVPLQVTVGFDRIVLDGAGHFDLLDPQSHCFDAVLKAITDAL
jgi:acetyl esterase/lipase